ncbi:MAG: hypothetical protein O3B04_03145 [Chloroflexi bacterium]|nr:hypothetical protein [Chloroflexota bacterium]
MLFKLYLLGQLISLPFAVGALGNFMGSSNSPSSVPETPVEIFEAQAILAANSRDLCDALHRPVHNSVQDDIQQLKFITAELYGEEVVEDCFAEEQAR